MRRLEWHNPVRKLSPTLQLLLALSLLEALQRVLPASPGLLAALLPPGAWPIRRGCHAALCGGPRDPRPPLRRRSAAGPRASAAAAAGSGGDGAEPQQPEGGKQEVISDQDLGILSRRIGRLRSIEEASWRELQASGAVPSARLYHTLSEVDDDDPRLVLFGGVSANSARMLDDTWILELPPPSAQGTTPIRWRAVRTKGPRPPGRAHHDAAVVQGRWLLVFGGLLETGARQSDTWQLDFDAEEPAWERVGGWLPEPVPRYHHSFVFCRTTGKLVLFGGHNFQRAALNDAWVLDVSDPEWHRGAHWREVGSDASLRPAPRAYHAAAVVGRWMLVSGGELADRAGSAEVWALDLELEAWRPVDDAGCSWAAAGGAGEAGRMRHMMCCLDEVEHLVATCGGQGRRSCEPRPLACESMQLQAKREDAAGSQESLHCRPLASWPGLEGLKKPRRDAALLHVCTGHLVLYGGNGGEWTDSFGDGYHQMGCEETLVADATGGSLDSVGEWHPVSRGAAEQTQLGSAVAVVQQTGQVIVVDHGDAGGMRVHALTLR